MLVVIIFYCVCELCNLCLSYCNCLWLRKLVVVLCCVCRLVLLLLW